MAEDAGKENICKSTEELLSTFEAFNKERITKRFHEKKLVIGSMDIIKWYNNTLAKPSAKVIKQMIIDFGVEFEGIEYDAIALHLGESMSQEEIKEEGFEEIVYIKNEKVAAKRVKSTKVSKH